jgi:S-adenosylmethionine synthetase
MEEVAIKHKFDLNFIRLINPTGRFVVGGSIGDAGVTGRKIIADTYGGYARHGGGAFSGKDPTKVDRSAAYMARYLAKWVLHKYHHLKECEIQLSYAIGVKRPVSIEVRSDRRSMPLIAEEIMQLFDLTPKGIIEFLDLKNTKYLETTCYGHFGKEDMTWEVIK